MRICINNLSPIDTCGAENPDHAQKCQQCGKSLRFGRSLHLRDRGIIIGHYRVVNLIGYGGFGAVYEAQDIQHLGERVALKETFDPENIKNFQQEFDVLHLHRHPNLPGYYELFLQDDNGYLVMEFIPGQHLGEVLKLQGGPLGESQVLGYAIQLCDALMYLHNQRPVILHRDIKPANVRVTPDGIVKPVDFGMFKQGTDTTLMTERALTHEYAPPEQLMSSSHHTDPRSDIFSLGAGLLQNLADRFPTP